MSQNNCGCTEQTPTPCTQPTVCECKVFLKSDCINNVTSVFECLDVESGLSLTETLEAIDQAICDKFATVTNFFTLINTGTGSEISNGVNNLGQKKIRKINNGTSNLIVVTQNTDDISITINTNNLITFIQANQRTYSASSLGDGVGIYKQQTTSSNNTNFEIRSLKVENQGDEGVSPIRDVQVNTNDLTIRAKKIKSNTLFITEDDETIEINTPTAGTVGGMYVNNSYIPSYSDWVNAGGNLISNPTFLYKGEGSLAKPYTESIRYTSSIAFTRTLNTAIQNALDAYSGDGQLITIQNSGINYEFAGNFNYTELNIKIETGAYVESTTTGFLIDMTDSDFNTLSDIVTIAVDEGAILEIKGNGFNNPGNTEAGITYATGKLVYLKGDGLIYSRNNNINKYLINSDTANIGNNNDGNLTFQVECELRADFQGIYNVGGNSRVDFYGKLTSGRITSTVDTNLKAFNQTGGQVRLFNIEIFFTGSGRDSAFTFTPDASYTPILIVRGGSFRGIATNLFEKLNNDDVDLEVSGSQSAYDLNVTNVFESPNLWEVFFSNNTIAFGTINPTKADLTKGNTINATNFVNGFLVESLRSFVSKESARLSLLPIGAAYLLVRNVNATNLQPNVEYKIITSGSPSLGTTGTYFVATGSETGTGVAALIERCVMV